MKAFRKSALGAIAVTLMALITPITTASADQGDVMWGGCSLSAVEVDAGTNGETEGILAGFVIIQRADGTPGGALIACWIDVNGVEAYGTRMVFRSETPTWKDISYAASSGDDVRECMQVWFDDGSTWRGPDGTNPDCADTTSGDEFGTSVTTGSIISGITVSGSTTQPCSTFLALRQLTGGNIDGVLVIGTDGDVYLNNPVNHTSSRLYNC